MAGQGFAGMSRKRHLEVSARGGWSAHQKKSGVHEWNSLEARLARLKVRRDGGKGDPCAMLQLMQRAAASQPPLAISTVWIRPSAFCSSRVEREFISAPGEARMPKCSECYLLVTSFWIGCQIDGDGGINDATRIKHRLPRRPD